MDVSTYIAPGQRYAVINSSITYNAVLYTAGAEFVGVAGVTSFTGTGSACEIIQVISSGVETYFLNDIVFPERLIFQESSLEIVQDVNYIIYPEQLTIYSGAVEFGPLKRTVQPQIVYCRN